MSAARAEPRARLQIVSRRLATSIFAGEYRSAFRGRGIEFEEVREYQPGDDIRAIDWNVSARNGRPFVKQYAEEREMTVMILLDLSASMDCATPRGKKSRQAAEIAALLVTAASRSKDRVGLLGFGDRIVHYLPPAKGPRHAQRLVAAIARQAPATGATDLAGALDYFDRVQRRGAIVFLLSDFLAEDFSHSLGSVASRHDVAAIALTDPLDAELPALGLLHVSDPESGARRLIDCRDADVRLAYRRSAARRRDTLIQVCAQARVDLLEVAVGSASAQVLARFFHGRRR